MKEDGKTDWLKVAFGLSLFGGALWLWSRTASAKNQSTTPERLPSGPTGIKLSSSSSYESPDKPGHEVFTTNIPATPGDQQVSLPPPGPGQVSLVLNHKYRARLELTGFERMGSREQIASTFTELGFSDVRVYMNAGELSDPPSWPGVSSDPGARWAEGTWTRASENIDKPKQVVQVQEVT